MSSATGNEADFYQAGPAGDSTRNPRRTGEIEAAGNMEHRPLDQSDLKGFLHCQRLLDGSNTIVEMAASPGCRLPVPRHHRPQPGGRLRCALLLTISPDEIDAEPGSEGISSPERNRG